MSEQPQPQENMQMPATFQSTGIDALDQVLHGGLPNGATILLSGAAGTGKTTLCYQWLLEGWNKHQEPGLFLSVTEPVTKALNNVKKLDFCNEDAIGMGKVHFADLRTNMEQVGFHGTPVTPDQMQQLLDEINNLVLESGAKRVVIDSITAIAYRLQDPGKIRSFIFELGTVLTYLEATVILTSEAAGESYSVFGVEEFICDGIIGMSYHDEYGGIARKLQIRKLRDKEYDSRPVSYRLGLSGVHLYPWPQKTEEAPETIERVSTGIEGLDEMTNGGYIRGSSVFMSGAAGTGKSIAAMHFLLDGIEQGEHAMFVSLEESRQQMYRNAAGFSWDFKQHEEGNLLNLYCTAPEENYLDELRTKITDAVVTNNTKRVAIDSLSALMSVHPEDSVRKFAIQLMKDLKSRGVTCLFTHATPNLFGAGQVSDSSIAAAADQIVMLRYVEIDSNVRHAALVLKMRGSSHEKELREATFDNNGMSISTDFSGYEGIMSGQTRKVSSSAQDQFYSLFLEIFGNEGDALFNAAKEIGLSEDGITSMLDELIQQGVLDESKKIEFLERAEDLWS